MTPQYAKAQDGRLWLREAGNWNDETRLYAVSRLALLKASAPDVHRAQINEIETALRAVGEPL